MVQEAAPPAPPPRNPFVETSRRRTYPPRRWPPVPDLAMLLSSYASPAAPHPSEDESETRIK